jgi:hypothetical protein
MPFKTPGSVKVFSVFKKGLLLPRKFLGKGHHDRHIQAENSAAPSGGEVAGEGKIKQDGCE